MSKLTAQELYIKLLEMKRQYPDHVFDSWDLLEFGDVEDQMRQLASEGKIIREANVIESFIILD